MTQNLKFEHERGASRSKWVAGALVLGIVGWMSSGYIIPSEPTEPEAAPKQAPVRVVSVAVKESTAQSVANILSAEGQAKADRDTRVRAETGGTISERIATKGQDVTKGQVLARIDAAQRAADLARAEADLDRAKREFDNATALLARGVATNDRVVAARSALAGAEAGLANARETMGDLDITAPFSGRLEAFGIQVGEFISPGTEVGRIVDLDPLTIAIQVPQNSVGDLQVGQPAQVDFITGETRRGTLSFVGTSANMQTRTFEAEITVDNPGGAIPAGVSAQVFVPTGETQAHFLSPAILSLNTDGTLGVKAVGEANTVVFYPVNIIRAETDGVYVDGLPDTLSIITIGQGFVNAGEVVDPQPAEKLDLPDRAPKETKS